MGQIISLWVFSCNVYQHAVVKEQCLYVQDEYGVDVPLLLFCYWAGTYSLALSPRQLGDVRQLADQWTQQCIRPLRNIRRQMKQSTSLTDNDVSWLHIRDQVKSIELSAEKQLLEGVAQIVAADIVTDSSTGSPTCAVANVMQYFYPLVPRLFSEPAGIQSLADILHAVYPEITYDVALETVRHIDKSSVYE